jgi:hypothetical protein
MRSSPILYTFTQFHQLVANDRQAAQSDDFDPMPVFKLFTPEGSATWLLSELDPDHHDRAFGPCDLGLGAPELGYVSIRELSSLLSRNFDELLSGVVEARSPLAKVVNSRASRH